MESEGTLIISIYSIDFKLLFSRFCREILFLLNIDESLPLERAGYNEALKHSSHCQSVAVLEELLWMTRLHVDSENDTMWKRDQLTQSVFPASTI